MTDSKELAQVVEKALEGTPVFIVDITVSPDNDIVVTLDSPSDIDLALCEEVTRAVEAALDRDKEDYSLEVGSAGLTAPFTVRGQYLKNVGRPVEVLTADGRKFLATLAAVGEGEGMDFPVTLQRTVRRRLEGAKRPTDITEAETLRPADIKQITAHVDF